MGSPQGLFQMIYFDHASAAAPAGEDAELFARFLREDFANQEAAHKAGYRQREKLRQAEKKLSCLLTGREDWSVIWCNSATESFFVFQHCLDIPSPKIVTSALEHPALTAALKRLTPTLELFSPDRNTGRLIPRNGPRDAAVFHLVQSETGVTQQPDKLFKAAPGAVRFLDAVQGCGKMDIPAETADIIAVSGNKIGVPSSAALLLNPAWNGRENFIKKAEQMRHKEYLTGRFLPAAVFTFVEVLQKRLEQQQENTQKISHLNTLLRQGCAQLGLPATIPPECASAYILHVTAPGFQGGVLVRMLAEEGIMAASGSACASETKDPSPALLALGFRKNDAFSGLRFSLDHTNTEAEVNFLLSSLKKVLKKY